MINVNAKKVKDGYDTICEITGSGDLIFNELRALIGEFLSDKDLAEMLTHAMTLELMKDERT